jgi:glycosyltransferase involved in cell wall biosynthesis
MRNEMQFKTNKPKTYVVLDPIDPLDWLSANTLKDKSKKIVMFHGLLTRNKNVRLLLEAALFLPNVHFCIIGDGPYKRYLEIGAPKNVEFTGWIPFHNMYSKINNCDIGVALRSDNPGNNYVVTSPFLQYGIMGKPCLVTKRAVFGWYDWQFEGVNELVAKIKALLSRPEEGEKLRKYVLENHDAKKIANQIWGILNG